MCDDETKAVCVQQPSYVPKIPKSDSFVRVTKRLNHLSAPRTTQAHKNEYTAMPTSAALALNMEEPSTSSSYEPPPNLEVKQKPRSRSDVDFTALYRKKHNRRIFLNSANDDDDEQLATTTAAQRVNDTLPVLPSLLSTTTTKVKGNLSERDQDVAATAHQSDEHLRIGGDAHFRRDRALSAGNIPLERRKKIAQRSFRSNAIHTSFGDADIRTIGAVQSPSIVDMSTIRMGICPKCHRCRCIQCARPRQLPSKWICGDKCLLSSSCIVDTLSCMCCLKAFRYHCRCCDDIFFNEIDDHSTSSNYDEKIVWRRRKIADLLCVIVASLCLPCLCCYLPLKCCEVGVETIYCSCNDNSCHCASSVGGASGNSRRFRSATDTVIIQQPTMLTTTTTMAAAAPQLQRQRISH